MATQNMKYVDNLRDVFIRTVTRETSTNLARELNLLDGIKKDYHSRELLELLQNIHDPEGGGNDKKAEISLIGNTLRACNTGAPFNEAGIEAISKSYMSTKPRGASGIIGNKGIGFRAVLNWNPDVIKIFSGEFAVEFSEKKAAEEFKNHMSNEYIIKATKTRDRDETKFPMLSVPFNTEFPTNWKDGKYDGIYDTCIELHVDEGALENIEKQIKKFMEKEAESIIFLPKLKEVSFRIENGSCAIQAKCFAKELPSEEEFAGPGYKKFSLKRFFDNEEWPEEQYHVFSKKIDMTDEKGEKLNGCVDISVGCEWNKDKTYMLYHYFPTKLAVDFPVIFNGCYFLQQNRDDVTKDSLNEVVAREQLKFLIETALKFASKKHGAQALEMITPGGGEYRMSRYPFVGQEEYFYELARKADILPTVNGAYISIASGNPKILPIDPNTPHVFRGECFGNLLSFEIIPDFKFIKKLAEGKCDLEYKPDELRDIIDKLSPGWTAEERIDVFYWWYKHYGDSGVLPRLIKTKKAGEFVKPGCEYYLYSGDEGEKPANLDLFELNWVDDEDQKILWNRLPKEIKERESWETKIYRTISRQISFGGNKIFKERDRSTILEEINGSVGSDFGQSVKFIKFLFENYGNEKYGNWMPPKEVKWRFPARDVTVAAAAALYMGMDEYDNVIGDKVYGGSEKMKEIALMSAIGIAEADRGAFTEFIKKFGVKFMPEPKEMEINCPAYPGDGYEEQVLAKVREMKPTANKVRKISGIRGIDYLEEILTTAATKDIIEWLYKLHLENALHENEMSNVSYSEHIRANAVEYPCPKILVPGYIFWKIKNTKWIKGADGAKYMPKECLFKKGVDFVPVIPEDLVPVAYMELWKKFGVAERIVNLSSEGFYRLLLNLSRSDDNGSSYAAFKSIYNEVAKYPDDTKHLNAPDDFKKHGLLYAVNRKEEKKLVPVGEARFSLSKQLNIKNSWILDTPKRTGKNAVFEKVFGVSVFEEEVRVVRDSEKPHEKNGDFQKLWNNFFKYLRLFELENENIKRELPRFKITLLSGLDVDGWSGQLPDYTPLKGGGGWYIYLNGKKDFDETLLSICIGDIFEKIINVGNAVISERISRLFQTPDISRGKLLEEWGMNAADIRNADKAKSDFVSAAKNLRPDADIESLITEIDFLNLSSPANGAHLIRALKKLDLDVKDFDGKGVDINLTEYYETEFNNLRDEMERGHMSWLYRNMKDGEFSEQRRFLSKVGDYQTFPMPVENSVNFDLARELKKHFKFDDSSDMVDCNGIYQKNRKKFLDGKQRGDMDEFLESDDNETRIYFGRFEELDSAYKKWLQERDQKTEDADIKQSATTLILTEADIESVSSNGDKAASRNGGGRSSEGAQRDTGDRAEERVYDYLCKNYDDVEWVSKAAARKKGLRGDDSLGYDIRYKKNEKWYYAEVKSLTKVGGDKYKFFISGNERRVAKASPENYEFFVVVGDNLKIIPGKEVLDDINMEPTDYQYTFIFNNSLLTRKASLLGIKQFPDT